MHQRVRGGRGARNKYTWGGGGGKMDITDGTGPSPPGWLSILQPHRAGLSAHQNEAEKRQRMSKKSQTRT